MTRGLSWNENDEKPALTAKVERVGKRGQRGEEEGGGSKVSARGTTNNETRGIYVVALMRRVAGGREEGGPTGGEGVGPRGR